MIAFLTVLFLIAFVSVIGLTVSGFLLPEQPQLRRLLASPAIGTATLLVPLAAFNEFGIGLSPIALPISIIIFSPCLLYVIQTSRFTLWKSLTSLAICILALCVVGLGTILYGFDWVGVSNGDALNYSTAAASFEHFGLYHLPSADSLINRVDGSQSLWYLYQVIGERPGVPELVAAFSAILNRSPFSVYPTFTFAMFVIEALAGASMLSSQFMRLRFVLPLFVVNVFCALGIFSLINGLAPQILGVALSACIVGQMECIVARKSRSFKPYVLIGLLLGALIVTYNELVLFVIIPVLTSFFVTRRLKVVEDLKAHWKRIAVVFVVAALCTNAYIFALIQKYGVFFSKASQFTKPNTREIVDPFPYFLTPSGLAQFWGLLTLQARSVNSFIVDLSIVIGALVLVLAILLATFSAIKGRILGNLTAFMFLIGVYFFYGHGGFPLFKIVLYIQPFVLCLIVESLFAIASNLNFRLDRKLPLKQMRAVTAPGLAILFVLVEWSAASKYIASSADLSGSEVYDEAWHASKRHLLSTIESRSHTLAGVSTLIDGYLPGPDSYIEGMKPDGPTLVPAETRPAYAIPDGALKGAFYNARYELARDVEAERRRITNIQKFNYSHDGKAVFAQFAEQPVPSLKDTFKERIAIVDVAGPYGQLGLQNSDLTFEPRSSMKNVLELIPTTLGPLADPLRSTPISIAIGPQQEDEFYPGNTMATLGQYLLFEVVNPTKTVALSIDYTDTFNGDGRDKLPSFTVFGKDLRKIEVVGRGSARIETPALEPKFIGGHAYIGLAFDNAPFSFPEHRDGLASLYGTNVHAPKHLLVGFVRKINSVPQQKDRSVPERISFFPSDLANPGLIYSGVYEDGWMSEHSFFELKSTEHHRSLDLSVLLPSFSEDQIEENDIRVFIDGQSYFTGALGTGDFSQTLGPVKTCGVHRVDIYFTHARPLSQLDTRPASALIHSIGFI